MSSLICPANEGGGEVGRSKEAVKMRCPKCQAEVLDAGARFCRQCGAPLRKSRRRLWRWLGLAVLLALLAGGGYWGYRFYFQPWLQSRRAPEIAGASASQAITDPCQQRLERIGKRLTALARTPEGVKELDAAIGAGREAVERLVKEPLTCPVLKEPYLLLLKELGVLLREPILLADPKFHPDKRQWALVLISNEKLEDEFIATPLPLPEEVRKRLKSVIVAEQTAKCLKNLRNLGVGLNMYVQDYDERFPPMKDARETAALLAPYLRNQEVFTCPVTRKPYQPNPHLHLKLLSDIARPAETPTFYDAQPHPDGWRGVAYADGHCKMLSESQWWQLQEQHKLPTPR